MKMMIKKKKTRKERFVNRREKVKTLIENDPKTRRDEMEIIKDQPNVQRKTNLPEKKEKSYLKKKENYTQGGNIDKQVIGTAENTKNNENMNNMH